MRAVPSSRLSPLLHRCVQAAGAALDEAGVGNASVLLGVSGGGDSMALLEIVAALAPARGLRLHVACIDHGLRSEAKGEAALVAAAASNVRASFHAASIDPGRGDEAALRRGRRAALEGIAAEAGCRAILLGHSADDQIETIVLRFLRGAGVGGLSGMRRWRPPWLRPLLDLRRETLRELLRERGVAWMEDETNLTDRYARGRLRRRVLPAIEEAFGRGSLDHLLDVAPHWRDDDAFLEEEAARLLSFARRPGDAQVELDRLALAEAPPALRSRALRRWIAEAGGTVPGVRHLAEIERCLASSGAEASGVDLPGLRLSATPSRLRLSATQSPLRLDRRGEGGTPSEAVLPPSGGRVRFRGP